MRKLAALLVLAGTGVAAEQALGDAVPIPPLPTVTVSTTLPVTVSTPRLPTTTTPVPAPSTSVTTTASTSSATSAASGAVGSVTKTASGSTGSATSGASAPSASGGAQSSSSSSPSSASSSSSGSSPSSTSSPAYSSGASSAGSARGSAAQRVTVRSFQTKRRWIGTTGPKRRRTTTLIFVLPARARVTFYVNQVWPACRSAGRFSVLGRAGLNRVRFAGRVRGRQLPPGTYRISARTARGVVQRVTLIIVSGGAPTPEQLAAARAANVCKGSASAAAAGTSTPSTGASAPNVLAVIDTRADRSSGEQDEQQVSAGPFPAEPNVDSGVLGTSVEETVRAIRPALVALLAAAILLLGLASLPPAAVADRRVNDMLARHRLEIAGIGVAALVATAVAFLLV